MNQNDFINELNNLNIYPSELQLKQLDRYYELLIQYNKVMNLTGITEKEDVYLKHFYDSLTIVKVINLDNEYSLCDIGTGAGFPGVVLKILFPKLKVTLVDSLNKRINFLNIVIDELNLTGIVAIQDRIEEYGKKHRELFDIATARAVASLNVLLEFSIPLVKINGYFIPLKGKLEQEPSYQNALNELHCIIEKKIFFQLPKENSSRNLLLIKKCKRTDKKYPRDNAKIKKQHL